MSTPTQPEATQAAAPSAAPGYSISVRSYEVFNSPGTGTAVHNEIIFRHNGQVIAAMNGNPWKRETGQPNYPGIGDNNTLRVHASPTTIRDADALGKFPVVGEQTLYTGSDPAKFAELLGRATEAANFINAQNMDYIMVDPARTAQNSNSVAHTLAVAMGLQYPPETDNLWAPGHGRTLLPANFRSVYEDVKNNPNWVNDPAARRYGEAIGAGLERLSGESVGSQVRRDPTNPNLGESGGKLSVRIAVPTYFNPQEPTAMPEFLPPRAPAATAEPPAPAAQKAAAP